MSNTTVINLLSGSGTGKSTLASGLFYTMKSENKSVELVTEFIKGLAWQGHKIGPLDQFWISGEQSRREASLYGKVDYIITDSPLLLSPAYESFYKGKSIVDEAVNKFLLQAEELGVEHKNYFLKRNKVFDPRGRYETEQQAKDFDEFLLDRLNFNDISYTYVDVPDSERISFILNHVYR